jgi:hypothetical protein
VTSSPGAKTCTTAGLSCTVTGLTNGTGYTFTVVATNAIGDSLASDPSNAVTPVAVPAKPAAPTAVGGDQSALVSWAAVSGNGSPVTGYTVTSSPGGKTCTTAGLSCTVTGLTNGTAYTFTVVATNAVGDSLASDPSDAVTPVGGVEPEPVLTFGQPDGWISTAVSSRYVGDNVYNTTGYGQTKTAKARRKATKTFYVRVYNDGNAASTIAIRGTAARAGSTVRYYSGTANITNALRSPAGWNVSLDPSAYTLVTVKVTIRRTAKVGSLKPAMVTSTWVGDSARTDAVKAVVKVVR